MRRIETYEGMSVLQLAKLGTVFVAVFFFLGALGIVLYSGQTTGSMSFAVRVVLTLGIVDAIAMCVVLVLLPAAQKREHSLGYSTAPADEEFPLVDSRTGVVVREVGAPTLSRTERKAVIEQYLQQSSVTGPGELK